ncbi:MAG: dihydroorotase [Acidimicrobiia bacterium]
MILIRGGDVFSDSGFDVKDVLIDGERIAAVGAVDVEGVIEVVDASGCLVGPGFVDMHTHLRDPGHTWKEDIASGCAAAAAGGFTAVVAMPNTDPPIDGARIVEEVVRRGREAGLVEVAAAAAMTLGRAGLVPSDIESLYECGVRIFTDDGDSVADAAVLRSVMARIAALPGAIVAQHAEDASMTVNGHIHEGTMSARLDVGGLPAHAEVDVVRRDLDLVRETGAGYHCQHVSAAETIELIRNAKAEGLAVTAEVTPHHLSFDEAALLDLDTDFKMYPPLRSGEDRWALREALNDGTIDVVATDHAPHAPEEKAVAFEEAPRGVIGLETAAAVVSEVVEDPRRMFEALSLKPALIASLRDQGRPIAVGEPANIVVFDPRQEWTPETFVSRSSNSPYKGYRLKGRPLVTVHNGRVVYSLIGAK